MSIQTKAQRIAELESVLRLVHKDLLQRGTKEADGGIVVEVGAGTWYRLCHALKTGETGKGKPESFREIPKHHRQWFEQLKRACDNGDLAIMSCLDATTLENRTVIAMASQSDGEITFIPVGHLAEGDNPFDAYVPPLQGKETIQ